MQISLIALLQVALLILVIAAVVAMVQLIIILVDIRQVTSKLRKALSTFKLIEYFFDGDELKGFLKKSRKALFGAVEYVVNSLRSVMGGEKNG